MAYAAGDVSLASLVRFHPNAIAAGTAALSRGACIVTDVRAAEVSLDRARLGSLGSSVHCAIGDSSVASQAKQLNLPRAVMAMRQLAQHLDEGIAVIGTAPTALLAVLDLVDSGQARPALIIGTPVGLVAATESKSELMARDVPYITVEGTRGGSALAASAANALLRLALNELPQA
jgi:precorrin-8X/cobalt-precorrin-8 methylmutase